MAAAPGLTLAAPRRKGQHPTGVPGARAPFAPASAGGVSAGIEGWAQDGARHEDSRERCCKQPFDILAIKDSLVRAFSRERRQPNQRPPA